MAAGMAIKTMERTKNTVVILHGIGHTRWNMIRVEKAMANEGYETINITYPSLRMGLKELAFFIHKKMAAEKTWSQPGQIHFVTHSMGGLVARRYLEDYKSCIPAEKMGRLIMIAPPNGGSEVADFLKNFPLYKWLYGPAGQELTTAVRQADRTCLWYEAGIIAGNRGWPYFIAQFLIAGDHDGRVAVEKTKMTGMKDHIIVPCTHSFISWNRNVHDKIIEFLEKGNFTNEK
jgi:pimeloyl-ACP methyl ester carboxylesterase